MREPRGRGERTLLRLCEEAVVERLCEVLQRRKAGTSMNWVLDHREWSRAMRLRETAAALRAQVPARLAQAVLREGVSATGRGANRDLQACFFELMVEGDGGGRGSEVTEVSLPSSLRRDEVSRLFFLETLARMEENRLSVLNLGCYGDAGGVFYMSDRERELLCSVLGASRRLVCLHLHGESASIEQGLQTIAEGCRELKVLDLRNSPGFSDDHVAVLVGEVRLVRKNAHLVMRKKQSNPHCAFKNSLAVLDLRGCRISPSSIDKVKRSFPNLRQVLFGRE